MHQSIKPSILSTFGDIALAIGPVYEKYLQVVVHILKTAGEANVDKVYFKSSKIMMVSITDCLISHSNAKPFLKYNRFVNYRWWAQMVFCSNHYNIIWYMKGMFPAERLRDVGLF